MPRLPSHLPFALLCLGVCAALFAPVARAQISVQMTPAKDMFVAHEPITVNISITNRAGRDIVLSGRGSSPWLNFDITDSQGQPVSPRSGNSFEPVVIPAGRMLSRTITLNSLYNMSRRGVYRVEASVYFPQLDQYFRSRPESLQVADGRELWHQVVGVPDGRAGAGTYRRFTLLTFNNGAQKELYIRVQSEKTGGVLATFSLGQVITIREPQWTIDAENRLHILHMGAPRTFAHSVIDVDGKLVSREIFREDGLSRPNLARAGENDVVVTGGISNAEAARNPLSADIRPLSDRPEGLPRLEDPSLTP